MVLSAKTTTSSAAYTQSIHEWQQQRNAALRSSKGWLTLVGLFWLRPGGNSIGSATANDFVLPKGSVPSKLGLLTLTGDKVTFTNEAGGAVTVNGKPVSKPITLSDDEDKPDVVRSGTVSFFVIKRGDQFGIRAKDSESPVLKNFRGVKDFPVDPQFRFEAKFIPDPKKVKFLNILGKTGEDDSPGYVQFTYQGKPYTLRPTIEDNTLFFVFRDPTSKTSTYQPGRMLNTPMPVNGKVDLDFNKATIRPASLRPTPPVRCRRKKTSCRSRLRPANCGTARATWNNQRSLWKSIYPERRLSR